eukprot:CAMPEP_0178986416 /NCGR_PEP_ID=MMETSP0795-20121207/2691_1 /TAXON_ID=88552 /ORGANISM="Amoebophrya sp., Strain Ameob2" /LENGTH=498 /DNA_ID=CAMNT_0020677473 /DNA_START=16 /DNA_END=1513 /DNA_ORIENTATION=-
MSTAFLDVGQFSETRGSALLHWVCSFGQQSATVAYFYAACFMTELTQLFVPVAPMLFSLQCMLVSLVLLLTFLVLEVFGVRAKEYQDLPWNWHSLSGPAREQVLVKVRAHSRRALGDWVLHNLFFGWLWCPLCRPGWTNRVLKRRLQLLHEIGEIWVVDIQQQEQKHINEARRIWNRESRNILFGSRNTNSTRFAQRSLPALTATGEQEASMADAVKSGSFKWRLDFRYFLLVEEQDLNEEAAWQEWFRRNLQSDSSHWQRWLLGAERPAEFAPAHTTYWKNLAENILTFMNNHNAAMDWAREVIADSTSPLYAARDSGVTDVNSMARGLLWALAVESSLLPATELVVLLTTFSLYVPPLQPQASRNYIRFPKIVRLLCKLVMLLAVPATSILCLFHRFLNTGSSSPRSASSSSRIPNTLLASDAAAADWLPLWRALNETLTSTQKRLYEVHVRYRGMAGKPEEPAVVWSILKRIELSADQAELAHKLGRKLGLDLSS